MKRALFILLALVGGASAADHTESNSNLWLNYVGDHPLFGSKWGLHLESQIRRADFGENWQQLLLRPGINYTISPTLTVSAGYAWVETHPYGDIPVAHEFPEHRLWEQAVITHKVLGLDWTHRFRLEQRRIGEVVLQNGGWDVQNWRYENRIRYMLRTTIPLSDDKKWYLALWDELFFNFGSNVSMNYLDQNRAFIGLGRQLSDTTKLEIGFMEQTVQRRGGIVWENNHTITVWLMSKRPFGKS
ncbi:DUF2490 domain-containing protein [Prosthecobacter sp.]|uniref:DUF2490 domain-containing protein n=1 Tax=Prosthecobacter sp. TaxID=1965333 RepID=UPI002AB82D37|nr:DUF2490 domain-containing protein [Prosthecobacter sp.]MDZ4403191.1 DUF2490 domain-containing protein [Prosthecobacter sp.]